MNFSTTYNNKRVFLTGHTGFKGAWMSIWLDMLGATVMGYSLTPDEASLYRPVRKHLRNHKSVIGDVRNKKRLKKEILDFQPDFIFHFAAQSLVLESYIAPVETFETNAIGTTNLLDAVRFLKKKCIVVVVTTDKVYKNTESGIPFMENNPLGGHDPYSASKAVTEIISESYRLSFFPPQLFSKHKKSIATARAGNVIGGGDYAKNRLIPDIVKALKKGKNIIVRNPKAVRPWQHVLEPLSGYLSLGAAMVKDPINYATAFNFGPDKKDDHPVEYVVKNAIKYWGKGKYEVPEQKIKFHESGVLRLNTHKANTKLKWSPKWNALKAIEHTMSWYSLSQDRSVNQYKLCIEDIEAYNKK